MKLYDGGVTAPKGFQAIGICAGIKKNRKDMSMIRSEKMCTAAGVFTQNLVKAAPVVWDMNIVKTYGKAQAMVINSGTANACTGKTGHEFCFKTAECAARVLGLKTGEILLGSTGVIGRLLPIDQILSGVETMVPMLSDSREAASAACEGMMTTDTVRKEVACSFEIGGRTCTIGGMTKGAGMIHPNMGTMICVLTTDCAIEYQAAQEAIRACAAESFNMISVDGDQSTNDTCVLLANGMAENECITLSESGRSDYEAFKEALMAVMVNLAKRMAKDGEGAHALFEVIVKGASDREKAAVLAKSVIESSLVKTAIAGHDANWGRIFCALGYAGVPFDPDRTDLTIRSAAGEVMLAQNGMDAGYSEETATKILSEDEITAVIDIKEGTCSATAWGCDLTHEYIDINADYRS